MPRVALSNFAASHQRTTHTLSPWPWLCSFYFLSSVSKISIPCPSLHLAEFCSLPSLLLFPVHPQANAHRMPHIATCRMAALKPTWGSKRSSASFSVRIRHLLRSFISTGTFLSIINPRQTACARSFSCPLLRATCIPCQTCPRC